MRALCGLLLALLAGPAGAATYYVNPATGSYSYNGLSANFTSGSNGPFISIFQASGVAPAGSTICVTGANVAQGVETGQNSGTPGNFITYQGNCTGLSQGVLVGSSSANALYLGTHIHHLVIEGFEIRGPDVSSGVASSRPTCNGGTPVGTRYFSTDSQVLAYCQEQNSVYSWITQYSGASTGSGSFASRPAYGNTGNLYFDTTNSALWKDDGTFWERMTSQFLYAGISSGFGVHDIVVYGNDIHGNGGDGVDLYEGDRYYIGHNRVYGNARNTVNAVNSGISVLGATCLDERTGVPTIAGCGTARVIIDSNDVFDNIAICCQVQGSGQTDSDGNGIIIDDAQNHWGPSGAPQTYPNGTWWGSPDSGWTASPYATTPYAGHILVINNTVRTSGCVGIHVFFGVNTTVAHNTVWHSGQDSVCGNYRSADIDFDGVIGGAILNNIVVTCGTACPSPPSSAWHPAIALTAVTVGSASSNTSGVQIAGNQVYDDSAATTTVLGASGSGQGLIAQDATAYSGDTFTSSGVLANVGTSPALNNPTLDNLRPTSGNAAFGAAVPLNYSGLFDQEYVLTGADQAGTVRSTTAPSRGAFEGP